jgi:ATP-dependent DNA helicase RecG
MARLAGPLRIAEQGDDLAFQPETTSIRRLAETLVAFANAGGGTVVLGVDARSGAARDLTNPVETMDRALRAALSSDPPLIVPLPELVLVDGQQVLVVTIPRGLPHVYSYRGKYLVRDGTDNRPLKPLQLRQLMVQRGAASFEALVPDGAGLDDIEWGLVEPYVSELSGLSTGQPEAALLRRGCLSEAGGALSPTFAGLLIFGREPQRWARSSGILVARYGGTTMDDRFLKEEIRGTLPEQIRRAEAFVVSNMRRGVRLLGLERVEQTEYPAEVIREAIVNAVAHRDYQIRGDEIRILMFADRIEVYSPGRLPGHVTVANIVDERFSRNESIVQVLSDMGFIERLGYGIDRMMKLMAEAGLPPPRFKETAAGLLVTLHGLGDALISHDGGSQRWRFLGLNERQEKALAYLAERGRITNGEYQTLCPDVSAETIRRDLADLVRKDLLLKIGEKRATYYIFK